LVIEAEFSGERILRITTEGSMNIRDVLRPDSRCVGTQCTCPVADRETVGPCPVHGGTSKIIASAAFLYPRRMQQRS
jgi:hypothetical protein